MPVIFGMLEKDHRKVRDEMKKLLDTSDGARKTRERLFAQIKAELEVHTKFEEQVFYPAVRKIPGLEGKVSDGLREHNEAKSMLNKLDKIDKTSAEFMDTLRELQKAVEHHIKDEEQEMFPKARPGIENGRAREMADQYKMMKEKDLKKAA